jgi:hypothetical protein
LIKNLTKFLEIGMLMEDFIIKVIDIKNPQEGIKDLRYIDPMKMRYIRQEKTSKKDHDNVIRVNETQKDFIPEFEEYFVYYTPIPNIQELF